MLAQVGRAAMVPLWTAQLLTGTKSFERNRVIGNRRLNQHGLHVARVALAHRVAAMRRNRLALPGPPDPQTALHADTFHPTVKAWLFLTDVAADAGPFTYVPGSHRLTPERLPLEMRSSPA